MLCMSSLSLSSLKKNPKQNKTKKQIKNNETKINYGLLGNTTQ